MFGGVFITSRPVQLYDSGFVFNSSVPAYIPEKTDIEMSARAFTVGGATISAGLIGWMEDED